MSSFGLFFGWPNGQVWPNLIASSLTFGAGFMWARRFALRHLEDHLEAVKQHIMDTLVDLSHHGEDDTP